MKVQFMKFQTYSMNSTEEISCQCSEARYDDDNGESEENPVLLNRIIELLTKAGYLRASATSVSPLVKLTGGLSYCIAASKPNILLQCSDAEAIEVALKSMRCPYPLEAHQIQDLDYEAVYSVVQWLVNRLLSLPEEDIPIMKKIDDQNKLIEEYKNQLRHAQSSLEMLEQNAHEQDQEKEGIESEMYHLNQKASEHGASIAVEKLMSFIQELKNLEMKELDFQNHCMQERAELEAQIGSLTANILTKGNEDTCLEYEDSLSNLSLKLETLQMDLAKKHQSIALLQRKLEEIPSYTELIQYERRFAELYEYIQAKLRETRRYYGIYNALVEANQLMSKEISLLNSISSQFENAIISASGRAQILESMEAISKGVQQKLGNVQAQQNEEQGRYNSIKERYTTLLAEHRQYYSLLKSFQEECTRHEHLQASRKTLDSATSVL